MDATVAPYDITSIYGSLGNANNIRLTFNSRFGCSEQSQIEISDLDMRLK
jgi:hypothetical protein